MKKEPIQIVYIITKLELGGAQKVCLSLFKGMQQKGHETFLISGASGPLVSEVSSSKTALLLPSFVREVGIKSVINEMRTFFTLIKTLRRLKKEYPHLVVHTHSTKAGIIGRWAALFAGIRSRVHTVHGYAFYPHQPIFAWYAIYLIELITSFITTHYICVSSADVGQGINLFPGFAQKHSIIRAAIDQKQFMPAQKTSILASSEPFIVGTIACFKKQKNIIDLIQACAHAYQHNPHIRLEIIGDGILRSEIEQAIIQHNIQHITTLHGWQNDVANIMKTWNIFALTSLWEGLPCSIIEARLLKLPVLAYDTGGIQDVIIDGENGFLYTKKDWHGLAQDILKLSKEQKLYKKMSQYHDDLSLFDNTVMVRQHIKLYKSL